MSLWLQEFTSEKYDLAIMQKQSSLRAHLVHAHGQLLNCRKKLCLGVE